MNKLAKNVISIAAGAIIGGGLYTGIDAVRSRLMVVDRLKGNNFENMPAYKKAERLSEIYKSNEAKSRQQEVASEIEHIIQDALARQEGTWASGILFPDGEPTDLSGRMNPEVLKKVGEYDIKYITWVIHDSEKREIKSIEEKYKGFSHGIKQGFDSRFAGENPGSLFVWYEKPDGKPSPEKGYLYSSLEERERAEGQRLRSSYKEELNAYEECEEKYQAELTQCKEMTKWRLDWQVKRITELTGAKSE